MDEWSAVAKTYPGWSLTEIKGLTRRERNNWITRENAAVTATLERMGLTDG